MTAAQRYNAKMESLFEAAKPGGRLDALWNTGDPLPELEQARRGLLLIDVLALRVGPNNRVNTLWGDKTALGLYRTVKRILEEGK